MSETTRIERESIPFSFRNEAMQLVFVLQQIENLGAGWTDGQLPNIYKQARELARTELARATVAANNEAQRREEAMKGATRSIIL